MSTSKTSSATGARRWSSSGRRGSRVDGGSGAVETAAPLSRRRMATARRRGTPRDMARVSEKSARSSTTRRPSARRASATAATVSSSSPRPRSAQHARTNASRSEAADEEEACRAPNRPSTDPTRRAGAEARDEGTPKGSTSARASERIVDEDDDDATRAPCDARATSARRIANWGARGEPPLSETPLAEKRAHRGGRNHSR